MIQQMWFIFQVKFEDLPSTVPGLYEAGVVVGTDSFGPARDRTKKVARKLAAIAALKELIDWEPKQGTASMSSAWPPHLPKKYKSHQFQISPVASPEHITSHSIKNSAFRSLLR